MTYSAKEHIDEYVDASLEDCVRDFLKLLDKKEISDNDREFNPNYIGSCRVLDTMRINDILKRIRTLVN